MQSPRLPLIALALLAFCAGALAGATLPLARDGQALQPIVISPAASAGTKAVAEELAGYLRRISGAEFHVEAGDGSRGIVLGSLAEFPQASLKEPLASRSKYDGPEAYALRTEATRLLLI